MPYSSPKYVVLYVGLCARVESALDIDPKTREAIHLRKTPLECIHIKPFAHHR